MRDKYINNFRLSPVFNLQEFESPDTHEVKLDSRVFDGIQHIRFMLGVQVVITSAYRTKLHNKEVGGKYNSKHLDGKAVDFIIKDVPISQVLTAIEEAGFNYWYYDDKKKFYHAQLT